MVDVETVLLIVLVVLIVVGAVPCKVWTGEAPPPIRWRSFWVAGEGDADLAVTVVVLFLLTFAFSFAVTAILMESSP